MKTTVSRIKSLVTSKMDSGDTLSYVKSVEVIHPDIVLTSLTIAGMPKVCVYPEESSEKWIATKRKEEVNMVGLYAILSFHTRETSIIGDATRKGILDFVEDLKGVLRGDRLQLGGTPYLSFPIEVESTEFADPVAHQNAHLLVAKIMLRCARIITVTDLAGDIA